MRIHFDFSPLRYLSQKFPVLSNPKNDWHSDVGRRDSIFRWPSDHPAWKIEEKDWEQIGRLGRSRPADCELDDNATVTDAIIRLDEWFIEEARSLLTERMAGCLQRWLNEQWAHFSMEPLPDDYLWSYLSILGDGGVDRSGRRFTIPPLVGRVEVAAYTFQETEDGPSTDWLKEGRFAHLCDRINEIFKVERPGEDARLCIDYRSPGLTRDWLERRNNIPYWPGAMQPTDHWLLRLKEVDQPRAERIVSRMLREPLAYWIKRKLPRVWLTLLQAAKVIDAGRCRVLPPIWSSEAFLLGASDWAAEGLRALRGRVSNVEYTSFLADGNPRAVQMSEAAQWLLSGAARRRQDRPEASESRLEGKIFDSVFSNWEEAILFVAALAEIQRQRIWEDQQSLFELHRSVCESLEAVIRQKFVDDRIEPTKKVADDFLKWIKSSFKGQFGNLNRWDDNVYKMVFANIIVSASVENGSGDAVSLGDAVPLDVSIEKTLSKSNELTTIGGGSGLGTSLQCLLNADILGPNSNSTRWRSEVDRLGHDEQLSDLLLAAKMLVAIRNNLVHGTIDASQPREDEVIIANYENKTRISLNYRSLELCFQFLVLLLNAFKDKSIHFKTQA